jgi:hypothetical protein
MTKQVEIETIEELRLEAGIDDIALRGLIGRLQVCDFVWLTLLSGTQSSHEETLPVPITWIRATQFPGKLTSRPACAALLRQSTG